MKAKKSLGQHFLKRRDIAGHIADAVSPGIHAVVEVGPGHGILTEALVQRFERLILIEKDDTLYGLLKHRLPRDRIEILNADFLQIPLDTLGFPAFALVGNFPYNISSQIVFHMLDYRSLIPEMVGMFQRELALRIVAEAGSKEYGIISVLTQAHYTGELLLTVPPSAFDPPPRVHSAVIRLRRRGSSSPVAEMPMFTRVVKTAFSQRRKMLRNTLRGLINPDELSDDLFRKRPEQLSLDMFYKLTEMAIAYRNQRNNDHDP